MTSRRSSNTPSSVGGWSSIAAESTDQPKRILKTVPR